MAEGEVWVFAEQRQDRLQDVGFELLGEGRKLADKLEVELGAVLLGGSDGIPTLRDAEEVGIGVASPDSVGMPTSRHLCQELFDSGADKVYLAESPALHHYLTEPYLQVLHRAAAQYQPQIMLVGATAIGTDLAPRLAARLKTGLSADCIRLEIDEKGRLLQIVPAFGGNLMATIICPEHRPQMATVRPGVIRKPEKKTGSGAVVHLDTASLDTKSRVKIVDVLLAPRQEGKAIEEAEVVIAGGWGIGNAQDWHLVAKLAEVLDGAVGATRPAVDEGWAGEEQMIGQSGKVVHPDLYIGIGISGAMHHMVGIQDSKLVVAINNDPKAQIFKDADIGLVGDFREIVPCLIDEIVRLKGRDKV